MKAANAYAYKVTLEVSAASHEVLPCVWAFGIDSRLAVFVACLLLFALSKSLECRMCDWELDCSSQRNLGVEHNGQRDECGTVMLVIAAPIALYCLLGDTD